LKRNGGVSLFYRLCSYEPAEHRGWARDQEVAMNVAKLQGREFRLRAWAKILPAVIALGVLSGCVVVPAYGPGYNRGYYAPGYYYRDRDDYYHRW
jgi:hypothetical protein